ncbi:MAG: MbtH family protein [Streptosporangiaceae bacterium]
MTNPFDDEEGVYVALANDEGQYSLWPAAIKVPGGWHLACQANTRAACLEFIEKTWTDMRPKSLIKEMAEMGTTGDGQATM